MTLLAPISILILEDGKNATFKVQIVILQTKQKQKLCHYESRVILSDV